MYELYSEILYEIVNAVGREASLKGGREALVSYLQEAFNIDSDKHALLLEKIKERKAPCAFLNVEIIEAKNLTPTDPNGLSDPFCILYLTSAITERHTTSVKPETLHPVWEECFVLPVKNADKDVLCLEVWDFDPEETAREKLKKIKEVKGMKGIKILVKEIAAGGRHNKDLIGHTLIPLKNIPAAGQTVWCNLERCGKATKHGEVKIHLTFGFEKNLKAALQEHRHLLYVILSHELQISKEESVNWKGRFSVPAEKILSQHSIQCGLSTISVMLARWTEFISVNILYPINFSVFLSLLQKLVKAIQNNLVTQEEEQTFWEAARKLIKSCIINIRKLQICTLDENFFDQSSAILSILSLMATLQPPQEIDLFPFTVYDWLTLKEKETSSSIHNAVVETIQQGSKDWFHHVLETNRVNESAEGEEKLRKLVTITDLAMSCLKQAISTHDKIFQEHFHFPYAKELYKLYKKELSDLVEPSVITASKSMKLVKFNDGMEEGSCDNISLTTGASLFQLYLSLQHFSGLGKILFPEDSEVSDSHSFYHWFYRAALQWLYISSYKAHHGIKKAIDLDQFTLVDRTDEYSSSAIDTLNVFEQIRIFWKLLAWPDLEVAFTIATNLIDDICNCAAFYADKISEKVEKMCETGSSEENNFKVKREWCVAVRNVIFVQQSVQTTVTDFGLEAIVTSLVHDGDCNSAENCRQTIKMILGNGNSIVCSKIQEMLDRAAEKMMPTINRLMMQLNKEQNNVDELMKYLDDTLCVLSTHLSSDNFRHILNKIWRNVSDSVCSFMENNLKLHRDPSFYKKQHEILQTIVDFFKQGSEDVVVSDSAMLRKVDHMLLLHGMETRELIHQYYLERKEEQKTMEVARFGLLTVRIQLDENVLRLEILNARNLQPLRGKYSCNPYIKISLLPEEKFSGATKLVTKTHRKSIYPLFDEIFEIELSSQQKEVKDGLVMFTVRDKCLLGADKFLAEGFLSFAEITNDTNSRVKLQNMEQLHLKLNRPADTDSEAFTVLKKREDNLARDFKKRRKNIIFTSNPNVKE